MVTESDPKTEKSREWNWHPDLPVTASPLFAWPPRPAATLGWFINSWLPITEFMIYVIISVVIWNFAQPSLEMTKDFALGWIAFIWLRNIILMAAIASALHLWLYTWNKQGMDMKYDRRGLASNNRVFCSTANFGIMSPIPLSAELPSGPPMNAWSGGAWATDTPRLSARGITRFGLYWSSF